MRATLCILHGVGPAPTTLFQALPHVTESNRENRHRKNLSINWIAKKWLMITALLLGDDLFKEVSSHIGIDGKRNWPNIFEL